MCFLLSSLPRSSSVSVVFDFNASLNDVVPASPILLSVDVMSHEKSHLLMDVFCVSFLLSSLSRLSSVSVVFDFNDSLNDVAPVSPMLLSIDVKRKGNSELLMDAVFVCLLSFVFTTKIKFSECWV